MESKKRQGKKILERITHFSKQRVHEESIKRFSEEGEVTAYSHPDLARGNFLVNNFLKKSNAKILDAGCASGSVSFVLAEKGFNIKAVDFSQKMIDRANSINSNPNLKFEHQDLLALNEKEQYDYVLGLFNLLTYVPNKQERELILTNLINALKPGGILIMDMINKFGNPRIIAKQIIYKLLFTPSLKNRPFGDVYSNPMFRDSEEPLFQHYLSKKEMKGYLKKFNNISYEIFDLSIFLGKKSKTDFTVIIKKNE